MPILFSVLTSLILSAAPETQPSRGLENPFFALDTATKDANHQTIESQVRILKELGYAGWGPAGNQNVPEMLKALDAEGLKMFALYTGVNIDPEGPAYDPKLKETLAALNGRDTIIWVFVTSERHKPSSTEGDERAVQVLREVADMAHDAGLRVSIYPHVNNYVERTDDAIRLAEKVNRRNLGVTFNLCHWLKVEGPQDPEPLLRRAMPYLSVVTINGADAKGQGWDKLIQPLGRGDYDVYGLLKTLKRLGYTGPIGFQGYGIKGDIHEVLKTTMNAWQDYSRRLAQEGGGAGAETPAKDRYDVILRSSGERKIMVIKIIRAHTNLGLKQAKDLVDGTPSTVKSGIPKQDAEKIKQELEESGATLEITPTSR